MALSRWGVPVAFGLAIAKFGLLAATNMEYLIAHSLSDDAFYYFTIARHAWEDGNFPTFDGVNKTNGFHYLYQLMLIPLVPLFADSLRSTYVVIIGLNAAFYLTGCAVLWRLAACSLPSRAVFPLMAYLLLGNLPFDLVATGMECSLAFMLGMTSLWLMTHAKAPSWLIGAVLGLLILARLDIGAIYAVTYGIAMLLRARRIPGERALLVRLGVVVAVSSVLVVPMFAYNYATFGHFGTISSATKMFVARHEISDGSGAVSPSLAVGQAAKSTLSYAKTILAGTAGDFLSVPYVAIAGKPPSMDGAEGVFEFLGDHIVASVIVVLAILSVAWALQALAARSSGGDGQSFSPLLLVFLIVVPLVHFAMVVAMLGRHGGSWYWLFFDAAIAVVLAMFAARTTIAASGARWALCALSITGLLYHPVLILRCGALHADYREPSWYSGSLEVVEYTKANAVEIPAAGCFNAGFYGYIAPHRVVNLDGLVNNWELLEARKTGRVREYVLKQGITHISDTGSPAKYLAPMGFNEDEYVLLFASPETGRFLVELQPKATPQDAANDREEPARDP